MTLPHILNTIANQQQKAKKTIGSNLHWTLKDVAQPLHLSIQDNTESDSTSDKFYISAHNSTYLHNSHNVSLNNISLSDSVGERALRVRLTEGQGQLLQSHTTGIGASR